MRVHSKFRSIAFTFLLLSPIAAGASEPLTVERVRELAYAEDHDRMETELSEVQAEYLNGAVSADDIRALFAALGMSHPEMVGFVEAWVQSHPESAFANAARAWSLYENAWLVRGEAYGNRVNPDAYAIYRSMMAQADEHARRAYELDNDLISASDIRITMVHETPHRSEVDGVLRHVLETRPNWGSLKRALRFAHPGYGGSPAQLEQLCVEYGSLFPSEEDKMIFRCLYFGVRRFYQPQLIGWLEETMDQAALDPVLDVSRADILTNRRESSDYSDAQIAFARETILNDTYLDLSLTTQFDNAYQFSHGFSSVRTEFVERNYERARAELKHDPLNPRLMSIVEAWYFRPLDPEMPDADMEALFRLRSGIVDNFFRRRLFASPYNADLWMDFGRSLPSRNDPNSFFAGEPYMINSIAYSTHPAEKLQSYLFVKTTQAAELEWLSQGNGTEDWREFARTADQSRFIRCPVLRAHLVLQSICASDPRTASFCSDLARRQYQTVLSMAEKDQTCRSIQSRPIEELTYSPVMIDWLSNGTRLDLFNEFE